MLNPLEKIKEINLDADLSATEAHVLTMMVLRADNSTGRVKQSQANIAALAGVSERTVRRCWDSPAVLKYFASITETGRWVHINLNTGHSVRNERYYEPDSKSVKVRATGHSVTDTGHSVHDTGHSVRPSTLYTTLNTTKTDASASPRVNSLQEYEQGDVVEILEPSLVSINTPGAEPASLSVLGEGSPDTVSGIDEAGEVEEDGTMTYEMSIAGLYLYIKDTQNSYRTVQRELSDYMKKINFEDHDDIESVYLACTSARQLVLEGEW